MKKILIISPHYPPSNLAAVHRSRLFAQHLPSFGWEPIILTVHEDHYEESLDWNLSRLLPSSQKIEKVKAFSLTRPRLIGDIGLRAFFQLRRKALQIIQNEKVDFVYIPIPSFYVSLIGPYVHRKTGVPYGIDYVDPWVHVFPGSEKIFSRHWFSTKIAKFLEPFAVKRASLITGVAEGYYQGVQERNPELIRTCRFGAMPYGGEELDHKKLNQLNLQPYLFQKNQKLQFVYAGALLPKAYEPLRVIFNTIKENREMFSEIEFHFIGTGKRSGSQFDFGIKQIAEEYQLWESVVFEYPDRIPYLDVLVHLSIADAIFVLGSTEPHYTPSKIYQAVLSEKPVMAMLHKDSTGVSVLKETGAGRVLTFEVHGEKVCLQDDFLSFFKAFRAFSRTFDSSQIRTDMFLEYSANNVTKKLVELMNLSLKNSA